MALWRLGIAACRKSPVCPCSAAASGGLDLLSVRTGGVRQTIRPNVGCQLDFPSRCPSFGGVNHRCQDCGVGRVDMTARIDMIGLPVGQQMYLYHRRLLTIDILKASLQT